MIGWYGQAKGKLEKESGAVKGQKEGAMKGPVRNTLLDFCQQNEEFAQAVAQGGSFADCMKTVAKGVSSSISDLEAYKRAVSFYFPGAEIKVQMWIQLEPDTEAPAASEDSGGLLLDFSEFW